MAVKFSRTPELQRLTEMVVALVVAGFCLAAPAHAQWLKYKTPGIPRLPDGKPDLSAPAPRMPDGRPDLSGLWRNDAAGVTATGKAMDSVKPQPWAVALTNRRKENAAEGFS